MEPADIEKLVLSCRTGNTQSIKTLLEAAPALLDHRDTALGWSPLYRTVICGHEEATHFLLQLGADPNITTKLGETPLHQAVTSGNPEIILQLLNFKADANSQQSDGDTPLHLASLKGNAKAVALLLQHSADPNVQNSVFAKTPLHYAVENDHPSVVKLLVRSGAASGLKDKYGLSPYELGSAAAQELMEGDRSPVSPLLQPVPVLVDIPPIPDASFIELNISGATSFATSVVVNQDESSFFITPSGHRIPKLDLHSEEFSPHNASLFDWLELNKLEKIFDQLYEAGYDDIEQMKAQMNTEFPVTEEILKVVGVARSGDRRKLLTALESDMLPLRSAGATEESESNIFKCCIAPPPKVKQEVVQLPTLKSWLENIALGKYLPGFALQGYEDLESLIGLMHSRWEVDEQVLTEVGVASAQDRRKILQQLHEDCLHLASSTRSNEENTAKTDKCAVI